MTVHRSGRKRAAWPLAALAMALGALPGQAGNCPQATLQEPLGTSVRRLFDAQAAVAGQDHYVFYELEWLGLTTRLGPAGSAHLDRVANLIGRTRYQVIIEENMDPALNQTRRAFMVSALLARGVKDAETRVVIGRPLAEGLYGEEAVPIYPLMITTRFRNRGIGGVGGIGGIGGIGLGGVGGLGGFGLGGLGIGGLGLGGLGLGGYGLGGGLGVGGYGGGYGPTTAPGYRGLGY